MKKHIRPTRFDFSFFIRNLKFEIPGDEITILRSSFEPRFNSAT